MDVTPNILIWERDVNKFFISMLHDPIWKDFIDIQLFYKSTRDAQISGFWFVIGIK